MKEDDDGLRVTLKTLGRVSQIGFTFAASVLVGVGIGVWLDNLVGTELVFKVLFLILGVASGLLSSYKTLNAFLDDD